MGLSKHSHLWGVAILGVPSVLALFLLSSCSPLSTPDYAATAQALAHGWATQTAEALPTPDVQASAQALAHLWVTQTAEAQKGPPTSVTRTPTPTPQAPGKVTATFTPTATETPTPTPTPTDTPTSVAIGGGTGRLAFEKRRDGNAEIWSVSADGSDAMRLSDYPVQDEGPTWSPDGRRIAFSSYRDGNFRIYVMMADGSNVTALTSGEGSKTQPDWCPDGTIAFLSSGRGDPGVGTMNEAGGALRLILEGYGFMNPSWSDDGSTLAVQCNSRQMCLADRDGSNLRVLTDPADETHYPALSPDGRRIVFDSLRSGGSDLYLMSADGSGLTRLTFQGGAIDPAWSPDGQWIAYALSLDGNYEIYVMRADGSDQRRVTDDPAEDRSPAWQPALRP